VEPAPVAPAPAEPAPPIATPIGQGQELPPEVLAQLAAASAAPTAPEAPQPIAPAVAAPAPVAPAAVADPHVRPETPMVAGGFVPAGDPPPVSVVPAAHAGAVDQAYLGAVTVDAGPFTDIGELSAFEQALARVPGVRDVYVRGFQGQRAIVDVDFGTPTYLVRELATVTTLPFVVNGADPTGLVVTIQPVTTDA
jgi:hypothetical protein